MKLIVGKNDLATTHPDIAKEAEGWDPTTVSAGSNKKREWKCQIGHVWKATGNDRKQGYGCPSCAQTGYDPNKKGYLYLLIHPDWEMLQIGITNNPDQRLRDHARKGWQVLETRGPMDGHLAQSWETSILKFLRRKNVDLENDLIAGKFDGYSESWNLEKLHIESIHELMKMTEEQEGS